MPLKIAILTWEYPPRIVGEMAYYVRELALEVSKHHQVSVITTHEAPYSHEKVSDSLEIHRLQNPVEPHVTVVTWALSLCAEVQRIVAELHYGESKKLDILDTNEWQFASAAAALKKALRLPFVLTLHSLEEQRSSNPSSPLSLSIRGLESLGAYECEKIITRSDLMRSEVERVHGSPSYKIRTVLPGSNSWILETMQVYHEALGYHV